MVMPSYFADSLGDCFPSNISNNIASSLLSYFLMTIAVPTDDYFASSIAGPLDGCFPINISHNVTSRLHGYFMRKTVGPTYGCF
jgi:hypothetical protein